MPRLHGPELYQQIKLDRPKTACLLMNGDISRVRLAKGVQFLPKPFTADALLRKVQELLPSVKLESIEYEHRLIVNPHARKDNVPRAVALPPSQAENVLNEVSL